MSYRFLATVAVLLLSTMGTAMATNVSGSWEYNGPAESGKWLKTEQRGNQVRFQLELQRGAPSYNSGWIEGEFELRDKLGTFQRKGDSGLCEIAFRFYSNRVEVSQSGSDSECGFGYNVWADGILKRKSKKIPKFSDSDPRFGE